MKFDINQTITIKTDFKTDIKVYSSATFCSSFELFKLIFVTNKGLMLKICDAVKRSAIKKKANFYKTIFGGIL
ncbi:MAG: hypothetical protein NC899_08265 [Candidatus Omnitrophica bacterium]|nr:hypothetical protein [Candidatus Omnitrophota bacterium]